METAFWWKGTSQDHQVPISGFTTSLSHVTKARYYFLWPRFSSSSEGCCEDQTKERMPQCAAPCSRSLTSLQTASANVVLNITDNKVKTPPLVLTVFYGVEVAVRLGCRTFPKHVPWAPAHLSKGEGTTMCSGDTMAKLCR